MVPIPADGPLGPYQRMRDFEATPEPRGETAPASDRLSFVVQKHAASRLHYDFRLELDGALKSWAVPKGPSLDPAVKRMAVQVEDHPLSYAGFEGTIPVGQYGAGNVIVWDRGRWMPTGDPAAALAAGRLEFDLDGEKLHGHWALIRIRPRAGERKPNWLLIKSRDPAARPSAEYDVAAAEPNSVITFKPLPEAERRSPEPRSPAGRDPKPAEALTHPDRVIDKTSGVTKGELADHYRRVAVWMLPHLSDRPVALVRAPAGVAGPKFFQKHAAAKALPGIDNLDPALDPEHAPLLVVRSAQGLASAAQMNVVELHTWNMRSGTMPHPDRMVFDLDPGEGVDAQALREGVEVMKMLLDELGLRSFLKTSGGKGLHVVVPLAPRHTWQTVRQFSEAVVQKLAGMIPQRFVAKSGPKNRVGRIFVDYLRNGWGATTACAWSARARPGLGVSVPVEWSELPELKDGAHFTVRNLAPRLALGNAPWADAARAQRQTLAKAMKALGFEAAAAPSL